MVLDILDNNMHKLMHTPMINCYKAHWLFCFIFGYVLPVMYSHVLKIVCGAPLQSISSLQRGAKFTSVSPLHEVSTRSH